MGYDKDDNPVYVEYAYLGLKAKEKDGNAEFTVENSKKADAEEGVRTNNDYRSSLQFSDQGDGYPYMLDRFRDVSPIADESAIPEEAVGMLSLTPAEARVRLNALVEGTGLAVRDIYLIDDSQNGMVDQITAPAEHYGYLVTMARVLEGVPVEYEDGFTINFEDRYAPSWSYEHADAVIDDRGVINFRWEAPYAIVDTVSEHTAVLSFEEIIGIFQKMMPVTVAYNTNISLDDLEDVTINIDRMTLSLQRILVPNTQGKGTLVPVWNFYGTHVFTEKSSGYTSGEDAYRLLMTINAIDGSMIDLDSGY